MAGCFGKSLIHKYGVFLFLLGMGLCIPLLFSCTGTPTPVQEDPFSVLSFSSRETSPSAYFVLPPGFMKDLLHENILSGDGEVCREKGIDVSLVKTLEDFFSRSSNVSAVMFQDERGTFSLKVLAYGNFPKTRFNLSLNASSGWERSKIEGVTCFNSGSLFVSIPFSGVFAAVFSTGEKETGEGDMADILAALQNPSNQAVPVFPPSFDSVAVAAVSGAGNIPVAFYLKDLVSLLPFFSGFVSVPGAGVGVGSLDLKGFKLPFDSTEIYVHPGKKMSENTEECMYTVNVCLEVSSAQAAVPAAFLLQMIMPDGEINREGNSFFIEKTVSGETLALAVFSIFLVSYL